MNTQHTPLRREPVVYYLSGKRHPILRSRGVRACGVQSEVNSQPCAREFERPIHYLYVATRSNTHALCSTLYSFRPSLGLHRHGQSPATKAPPHERAALAVHGQVVSVIALPSDQRLALSAGVLLPVLIW